MSVIPRLVRWSATEAAPQWVDNLTLPSYMATYGNPVIRPSSEQQEMIQQLVSPQFNRLVRFLGDATYGVGPYANSNALAEDILYNSQNLLKMQGRGQNVRAQMQQELGDYTHVMDALADAGYDTSAAQFILHNVPSNAYLRNSATNAALAELLPKTNAFDQTVYNRLTSPLRMHRAVGIAQKRFGGPDFEKVIRDLTSRGVVSSPQDVLAAARFSALPDVERAALDDLIRPEFGEYGGSLSDIIEQARLLNR